jgi:hypothetical protein
VCDARNDARGYCCREHKNWYCKKPVSGLKSDYLWFPYIIVADQTTIQSVDEKWPGLGLGTFIPSPSLKYKDQVYGDGAVAGE